MVVVSTCALMSTAFLAYGAEAQKMDESTNANTNVDVKTQNLQQKPNSHDAESSSTQSKSKTHHDHKSNVDQANDEMNGTKGSSDVEKMRQKPN